MADERKRKLEEIRRKKAQIQKMLKTQESTPSAATPSSSEPPKDPAITTSTKAPPEKIASLETSSDRRKSRPTFFEDSAKNSKLMQIHIKRINESLRQSSFTEFCQGVFPELKSEETQYDEEEKKIEEVKQTVDKMKNAVRRASVHVPKEKLKLVIHKVQQQQADIKKKE